MIKNEKGITLVALVVTIIVLGIIATISIRYGTKTVTDIENKKVMTELANVQQAVFEQYVLLKSYNKDGAVPGSSTENITLENDISRPEELIGTRVSNTNTLEDYGFTTYKISYDDSTTFEMYYYILTKSDLALIGIEEKNIENKDYSYIVNYSTGEVFDLKHIIYIDEYDSSLGSDPRLSGKTTKLEEEQYNFTE